MSSYRTRLTANIAIATAIIGLISAGACLGENEKCETTQVAAAQSTTPQATTPQATTQPTNNSQATAQPATSPEAMAALDLLERAGAHYKTVTSDVTYTVRNTVFGDVDIRTGWVGYAGETDKQNPRFRIHFETLAHGKGQPKARARLDYAFDGMWFIMVNHKARQYQGQQVAAQGQRVNPLKIGRGPFPIPFGQKTADVLEHFTVTARPAEKDEPAGTTYMELKTIRRFQKDFNLVKLEMWIDPAKNLPARIISHDAGTSVSTVDFANIQPNAELAKDVFTLPKKLGYSVEMKKLAP